MSTVRVCDHCGEPIDALGEINVSVIDRYLPKMSDLKSKTNPRSLHVQLDLHRACYEAALLPAIEALVAP